MAAGSNYGLLYAVAKGSGGVYGGVLSAVLITQNGFPFAMGIAGAIAIVAGLLIIPLKYAPPIWSGEPGERPLPAGLQPTRRA
jgi:OFA family oxalate/formate antiporter-like MFS transporter